MSASATRKQGGGVVEPARAYLARLQLRDFSTADAKAFASRLNETTDALAATFPGGTKNWGLARKLLNIFLRDALYTTYLAEEYDLKKSEALLEVPLDSISAGRIFKGTASGEIPKWPGVKHNTAPVNAAYQLAASKMARAAGISRVHLDTYWWGERAAHSEA